MRRIPWTLLCVLILAASAFGSIALIGEQRIVHDADLIAIAQPATPVPIQPVAAAAKRMNWSPAYVVAGPSGVFYAKCAPEDEARVGASKGTTRIYLVRKDADELLDSYDWYAPRQFHPGMVLGWSPIAGKIAVMRIHNEIAALTDERVELSFYLGGKLLKSYTTKELVSLGAKAAEPLKLRSSVAETRLPLDYKVLECEQVPSTNEYRFSIMVPGDKKVQFDILTGEVVAENKGK